MRRQAHDGHAPCSGVHILAVDDEVDERTLLSEAFHSHAPDLTLTAVADAAGAERHLRHGDVDLLLLDVHMPGMDGFQMLEHLRRKGLMEGVPTIFLTVSEAPQDAARARRAKADGFCTKPVSAAGMRLTVQQIRDFLSEYDRARA